MKKIGIILFLITIGMIHFGCNNTNSNKEKNKTNLDEEFKKSGGLIKLNDRLFSIPSPIQISKLVKELGIPYDKGILNSTDNFSNYSSTFSQALNLGIYGADLGYLNMYDQLPDAAVYFGVVKVLSKELGILSSIDPDLINRFETNKENKDSVLKIVSNMYRNADTYLMNNERNEIGIIILAGGWVESIHFLTKIAEEGKNQTIINRIAEQKYPLENLIELMRPFYGKQSDEYDTLLEKLVELASVFDNIEIKYTYVEPSTYNDKKLTVVNSTSKAVIEDIHLKNLTKIVQSIRNLAIK